MYFVVDSSVHYFKEFFELVDLAQAADGSDVPVGKPASYEIMIFFTCERFDEQKIFARNGIFEGRGTNHDYEVTACLLHVKTGDYLLRKLLVFKHTV